MADFADCNGARIVSGSVLVPSIGTWLADVHLVSGDALPTTGGAVTLTVGDLQAVGTVRRQGVYGGVTHARIVGGFGGWRNQLTSRSYYQAGGVPLSMVLGDAALELGEKIQLASDRLLATTFARPGGEGDTGAKLLAEMATPLWWMQSSGVTYVGARSASLITSTFTVIESHPERGLYTVAPQSVADFAPGRTFSTPIVGSPAPISLVEWDIPADGRVRAHLLVQ